MNELTVFQHDAVDVVDSRQVAEMTGVRHADLLEKIDGYTKHLANGNFRSLDFFIPSTYKDAQDKPRPCYLLTKKGCDMVANKMTGEKGVLFTAAYVTAFEAMRQHIQGRAAPRLDPAPRDRVMALNARTRAANLMTRLWNAAGVRPADQALALNGYFDGLSLPREAFGEVCTHTLDATAIADHLGVLSASGKPHNQAVAALIGELDLDESEQTLTPYSRNGHDGTSMQYAPSVEEKVRAWLDSHGWPAPLPAGGKKYAVKYRKCFYPHCHGGQ